MGTKKEGIYLINVHVKEFQKYVSQRKLRCGMSNFIIFVNNFYNVVNSVSTQNFVSNIRTKVASVLELSKTYVYELWFRAC